MSSKTSKTKMQFSGIVELVVGIILFMWARSHSPNMSFGEMMTKMDSYFLKPPMYYGVIIVSVLFAIGGAINLVKSLQTEGNEALPIAKVHSGKEESSLDEIRRAQLLFECGAINVAEFEKIKKNALEH